MALTLASVTYNALSTPERTLAAPSGQDVDTPHGRIHYQHWGSAHPAVAPLILVHGFAESTLAWSFVAPSLAREREVYAIDLPGFGYSEHTGRYSLADQVAVVGDFITHLKLERPVLVGHSLGAGVVGKFALDHPEQVSGVIFADGDALPFSGNGSRRSDFAAALVRTPFFTSGYRLVTRSQWLTSKIFREQCGSACQHDDPSLVEVWMRPFRQLAAEDALAQMASEPMPAMTPAQVQALGASGVKTGIVWGEEDTSSGGSLAGAKHNLQNPPTAIVPNAAHVPMVADPQGFVAALERVMSQAHMHRAGR